MRTGQIRVVHDEARRLSSVTDRRRFAGQQCGVDRFVERASAAGAKLDAVAVEYLVRDPDMVFVYWRKLVVVQVRRGVLGPDALAKLRADAVAIARHGTPLGALLVVEEGAPIPSAEARPLQRALVADMLSFANVRIATVTLGTDISATMARSAGRMVAMANPRLASFESIAPAVHWLVQQLIAIGASVKSDELLDAVETLRSAHRTSNGGAA